VCVLLGAAGFSALGSSVTWGTFTILERWLTSGAFGVFYLVSAAGLGLSLAKLLKVDRASGFVHVGLGLAALLTLSHGAGVLGLLGGSWGTFVAWLLLAPGLALIVLHSRRAQAALREAGPPYPPGFLASRYTIPGLLAAGVMLAAACLPPGVVWRSEFGGFDSLSYHLQLPKEWLLAGRIETLPHNVYSGLPSYLEAAFTHVAWLRKPSLTGEAPGVLDHAGQSLIAAQLLHAMLGLLATFAAARVAYLVARRVGADVPVAQSAAGITFSLLLLTPWTLVTGSLSYNEQGVAFFAACVALVLLSDLSAVRRTVLVAICVGIAASIKPTAMLFVGVPAGIVLLVQVRREGAAGAAKAVAMGCLVGLLTLAPWMVRNYVATRNPVFPFAASVFTNTQQGTGWWNAEQVDRFKRSHTFTGSINDRLKLTVAPDHNDPVRPSWRGVTNPQWGLLIIAGVLATLVCCVLSHRRDPVTRTLATALLVTLVVQLPLWLFATHIQSRFLLPLALPCVLGLALLFALTRSAPPRALLGIALLLTQSLFFIRALIIEHERGPAFALLATPTDFAGLPPDPRMPASELSPQSYINRELPADARVLLLGDATPLYFARTTLYATTYDTNPLFTLPTVKHDDPSTWSPALRTAGVTHVLVNLGELDRYRRSGFLDPRLDMARVQNWAMSQGPPLATWPNGIALFAVR
jgi:hypothetical protein